MEEVLSAQDAALTVQVTSPQSVGPAPVAESERIRALDSLRGFALLGILLMNIVAMGMYPSAYDNPTVYGGSTGANLWVWAVLHVLAEGKMRCLFSMVFGASMMLLTTRLEKRGDSADIYYRRTLWLLLFGVAHAFLLWLGDILYPYALCALALYPFRKLSAKALLWIGGIIVVGGVGVSIFGGFHTRNLIRDGRAAEAIALRGDKLDDKQQDAKKDYDEWKKFNEPDAAAIKKDADEWRGNPLHVIGIRATYVGFGHRVPYYGFGSWDIWSMMLIGMALFKLGVLTAERSATFYAKLALIGYGIGIPLNAYTAWVIINNHFDPVISGFTGTTYDLGRLTVALGHLGLLLWLVRAGVLKWLTGLLASVGQMAFSNYILQSVLTAIFFTGYGFKMYGRLERYQLYYVVVAVWIVNLVWSPIWLKRHRFGPLEWCWRSLTYWKRQPMRRIQPEFEQTAKVS
jgi:uncharacterized protein